MPATALNPTKRYYRPGVTKIYYVPTIGDKASPTRTEMDSGTDLSAEVAAIDGFQTTSESIDTPDLASRFTSKIPGAITADDSSITFYASSDSDDVRSVLPRDTVGFVLIMDEGDVDGQTMDVYPVTVSAAPKLRTLEDPAQIQIMFTITSEPAEDVEIPTAV